jgi:hypothetical protein
VYTQNVRLEVDYSKYLGKNACQTLKYDGAGMHVINHITPFDILIHIFAIRPHTGYLGKREGYKLPGGRALATSLQFMVTGRDTKDDKSVREKLNKSNARRMYTSRHLSRRGHDKWNSPYIVQERSILVFTPSETFCQ